MGSLFNKLGTVQLELGLVPGPPADHAVLLVGLFAETRGAPLTASDPAWDALPKERVINANTMEPGWDRHELRLPPGKWIVGVRLRRMKQEGARLVPEDKPVIAHPAPAAILVTDGVNKVHLVVSVPQPGVDLVWDGEVPSLAPGDPPDPRCDAELQGQWERAVAAADFGNNPEALALYDELWGLEPIRWVGSSGLRVQVARGYAVCLEQAGRAADAVQVMAAVFGPGRPLRGLSVQQAEDWLGTMVRTLVAAGYMELALRVACVLLDHLVLAQRTEQCAELRNFLLDAAQRVAGPQGVVAATDVLMVGRELNITVADWRHHAQVELGDVAGARKTAARMLGTLRQNGSKDAASLRTWEERCR